MNRRLGIFMLIAVTLVIAIAGWRLYPSTKGGPLSTNLYLNWTIYSTFAGDVLASQEFGTKRGVNIRLEPGGEGRDPLKLVRDGDFGVGSADEVFRAIDRGLDVVIIGVLQDRHPAAFASLDASGIRTPKDFEGKRVGLLPFGATGLIYQALIAKAGVNRSKIEEVVVSPDIRPFMSGRVNDVQPIFVYDEPVSLDRLGVKYNMIEPEKYGIHFKGQVYFTTRATLEKQPDLVRRVIAALVDSWLSVRDDPQRAVNAVVSIAPTLDQEREREIMRRALPYFIPSNGLVLSSDPATWRDMIDVLVSTKTISKSIEIDRVLRLEVVRAVHADRQRPKS